MQLKNPRMFWRLKMSNKLNLPGHAYDLLAEPITDFTAAPDSFLPNPYYEKYLKMHKVLVGERGADHLEDIYESLRHESMPRYLSAAGWAAVETALAPSGRTTWEKLNLLDGAADCWQRSLASQKQLNAKGESHLTEFSQPFRTAIDLAVLPLFRDMTYGNISPQTRAEVFEDCLNIAQLNTAKMSLMRQEGNGEGLADHAGLGYELNALLAFNRRQSETWFVVPSMVRCDTGYHHRQQTHDLMVVHQKWGDLLSLTPVEIKSTVDPKAIRRYQALLVRGKMHLSVNGRHRPEHTLQAITACHEGAPSRRERWIAESITDRFTRMVRDYYAGEKLGDLAIGKGPMSFRDNSVVRERHPGLKIAKAA
jgi:hypothetical protein